MLPFSTCRVRAAQHLNSPNQSKNDEKGRKSSLSPASAEQCVAQCNKPSVLRPDLHCFTDYRHREVEFSCCTSFETRNLGHTSRVNGGDETDGLMIVDVKSRFHSLTGLAVISSPIRFRNSVVSTTDLSSRAVGGMVSIVPVAVVATTVVQVIFRPRHGTGSVLDKKMELGRRGSNAHRLLPPPDGESG